MTQLEIVNYIIDICSKEKLETVLAPVTDLPGDFTKAEIVSHCLNKQLGAYGVKNYITPDKTAVYINDDGICKVLNFFHGKGYQPVLTTEHTKRVGTVIDFADKNKVDLLWAQGGLKKKYYVFKQYGLNGINLFFSL